MAEPVVRIVNTSVVKPSKPTPMHTMYLSGGDQIMKFVRPNRSVLFYKTDMEVPAAIHILTQSLASALVHFYPLAGRVVEDMDGRLALECNDDGVEVVEAYSDVSVAQLEETNYEVEPFFRKLAAFDDRECCDNVNDPLLSVQVTGLVGGFAVGVALSHVAGDGYSFWQFLSSLGQLCRGEALSFSPLHARTLLWPESFSLNRMHGTKAAAAEPYNGALEDNSKGFDVMLLPPEKLHQRLLHVSADMLKTLKRVGGLSEKGSPFTSFELLAAYCWKRITWAQELSDETRCDFRIPLDVRSRMIPAPTGAYFGNAVVGMTVPTTAGELKRESLGATAGRIREGVKSGDDGYIKQALKTREKVDLRKLKRGGAVLFNVRNASRFGVYRASEMGWGEAEAVRPAWEWREGEVTWYPGKEGGSIDVLWALSSSTIARFFSPELQAHDPLGAQLFPCWFERRLECRQ